MQDNICFVGHSVLQLQLQFVHWFISCIRLYSNKKGLSPSESVFPRWIQQEAVRTNTRFPLTFVLQTLESDFHKVTGADLFPHDCPRCNFPVAFFRLARSLRRWVWYISSQVVPFEPPWQREELPSTWTWSVGVSRLRVTALRSYDSPETFFHFTPFLQSISLT